MWFLNPTDNTIQYPLFKDVVASAPGLFEGCIPHECTFDEMKKEIVNHYLYCEINYTFEEFKWRFNQELRRQVKYLDHCIRTSKLEYDKLNYNKNETTTHETNNGESDNTNDSRFQDTPVTSVVNSDNYNTSVTKTKGNSDYSNETTSNTVFYHQTELKTNQDIVASEYEIYRNPFEMLFKKLDYLFMEVW